jgi:hypothetical protein
MNAERHAGRTPDKARMHTGRGALFGSAFFVAPKAQGMVSWLVPPFALRLAAPISFSHFFLAGSKRSGEGEESSARVLGAFIGAQRRPLTQLPRSVHSPAKKWEISPAAFFSTRLRALAAAFTANHPKSRIFPFSRLFSSGSRTRTCKPPIFRSSRAQPADPTRVNAR